MTAGPEFSGAELIKRERHRQILKQYSFEHDQTHRDGELAQAAAAFLHAAQLSLVFNVETVELIISANREYPQAWTFRPDEEPIENLIKAGALIAAEIDRLQLAELLAGEATHE